MTEKRTWHLEKRKLSDIVEWEGNPRILTDKGIKDLANSIKKFGCCEPLVINTNGVICGGHGRKTVLEKLGVTDVDCYVPDKELSQKEFEELNLRLNKNIAGEFDFDAIKNNYDIDFLLDVGFDSEDFEIEKNAEIEEDECPVVDSIEPIAKLGDVWQLGRHKIICGDCCIVDTIDVLFEGKQANQIVTDPPYGVDYASKNEMLNSFDKGNRNQRAIQNDNIENYRQFFTDFLSIIPVADYNTFYVFMLGLELHNLRLALEDCSIKWGDYLVWVKNNHVLGRKDYNSKHEFIIYGWKGKHKFYGDFSTAILEFDRPQKSDLHPTMKPIALLCKLIKDGSKKDDIVYDAFLGSGSTLIACETNRICYGCEIEPKYIDVIIARWEKLTDKKAVKINN